MSAIPKTKADQIKEIKTKMKEAKAEQQELQAKRMQRGIEMEEFMDISNRLSILSTTIDLCKKKMFNLNNGKSALGDATPGQEVGSVGVGGGYKK